MILNKKQRVLFWVTFGVCLVAEAFLIASLATQYWIEAFPIRLLDDDTIDSGSNITDTKFKGHIHFGLFTGYKKLDHGLGVREGGIQIECEASDNTCVFKKDEPSLVFKATDSDIDDGKFNFGLWLCTIIFLILGLAWGIVSMAFAVVNASSRPIETITGPMGLYLWNSLAAFCCLLAIIMYTVLYFTDLKNNVLNAEDVLWTSKDRAYLDYSFYFVVVSTVLFTANLVVVALSGVECHAVKFGRNLDEKSMDNVIMY